MAILTAMYRRFALLLTRPSPLDGRVVVIAMVLSYVAAVGAASMFTDYRAFWLRYLGVSAHRALFTDLGLLPSAAVCLERGYDPYNANPCDPFGHVFNYPRIWLSLTALAGLTLDRLYLFGPGLAILFFASILMTTGKLTVVEGLITGALVCSPAVMFGVERGNVDLFIFSLVAAALVLARQSAPAAFVYVPLLAAAILKLYPAAAFCISLREPTWKRKLTALAVLAVSFGVYAFSQRNDIAKITSNTLKSTYNSFGAIVIFAMIRRAWFPDSDVAWRILRIAAYAAAAGAVAVAFRIARYTVCPPEATRPALASFRAGASIYVTVFAVGYNWDYRLMFLLFTLPQLFAWVKAGTRWGLMSAGALIVMVTALWISSWSPQMAALDELGNWMLFIYFLVALLITTPQELFRYLQRGVSPKTAG